MLPLLACGPYSSSTLSKLANICVDIKAVGPLLDSYDKDKMDTLHTLLTKICQDSQLDVLLRLQVLEVIELRTLGWVRSEAVDNYYQERFAQQFGEARKEQERKDAKAAKSNEGEKKRKSSQTTSSMTSIQEQNYEVIVNGEKYFSIPTILS